MISTTFFKLFLYCQFVFIVLTMPSPTRESVLGLYTDSETTKGEAQPTKARYPAFPGFAGEIGPIFITALGKNLNLILTLQKATVMIMLIPILVTLVVMEGRSYFVSFLLRHDSSSYVSYLDQIEI